MKFSTYARRRAQGYGPAYALHDANYPALPTPRVVVPLGVILVCAVYLAAEAIDIFFL